ncbi:MAG TPA: molybdate ABC transporter substrate-binding protein, partial [Abditibacteriaceae bacterium]
MNRFFATGLLGLFLTLLTPIQAQSSQTKLVIAAAASLTDALTEIGTVYQKQHPNVKLNFHFGSSGTLQKQIENGAPIDVFVSA